MFATMWELHSVENVLENGRNEDVEEQVMQVKTKLFDFMDVLRGILAHSINPLFKEEVLSLLIFYEYIKCDFNQCVFLQAYISICDLLVVFCNQLGVKHYPVLGNLIYDSDKELQDLLNNFIQKNVFVYEEEGN